MRAPVPPNVTPITASIVTYGTDPEELSGALRSLCAALTPMAVFIIDNSPTDSLRKLVTGFGAQYEWTGENLGFGKAHNVALERVLWSSTYHLVCNPDVEFGDDVLDRLQTFMDSRPDVGLVMPKILYADGREQRLCKRLPTPLDLLVRRFLGPVGARLLRRRWDYYETRDLDLTVPYEIPCLSGCFMFLRTSVLREVGIFDARYFMYMEDVDLCRRVGRAARTVFFPDASIVHGYAKGSYKNTKLLRYHIASAMHYFGKWGWMFDRERQILNQRARPLDSSEQL